MIESVREYLSTLVESFGQGWNRFWFTRRDPYVLGVMRLLTGIVALYVIATYGPDLEAFFGENALLPIGNVEELQKAHDLTQWRFSYLELFKSSSSLRAGYVAALVVLSLFTVGLFSRVTSVLSLLVVLSFVHRAPQLTSQVEPILTMVLFYLCIGPCGASWSLDAWLKKRRVVNTPSALPNAATSVSANIATRLIQVHISVIYAMMALGKLVGSAWWDGGGVWWLVARPESRLFDYTFLSDHVYIVNAWTHAIVLYELTFPVLIWNRLARPLMLVLGLIYFVLVGLASGLITSTAMLFVANLAFVSPGTLRAMLACCRKSPAAAEAI